MEDSRNHSVLLQKLAKSPFRSRFKLTEKELYSLAEKGWDAVHEQTETIIKNRLGPAFPENDGRQTPMRGFFVFKAQHATATCCRGCLQKWHGIPQGGKLSDEEIEYIVQVILCWLKKEAGDLKKIPHTPALFW